jgi:hypothetical protein
MPWKNTGSGAANGIIYSEISTENIEAMRKNTLVKVGETFIRYNTIYNEFSSGTYRYYIITVIA